ncbi:ATP-binding protein [Paraglaciecola sp.]|uniref:ATP-binding protein n=1 Tax=Paraglaciecola sp. TaxID=1920173 RepID=UPI003EF0AE26
MKKLSLSLLFVVLTAAIGLGWTLDNFFAQMNLSEHKTKSSSELLSYRQMGSALANTLDRHTAAEQFLASWSTNSHVGLSLISRSELPLPLELENNFSTGIPLELESENNILIHFLLPSRQQVLILSIPKLNDKDGNEGLRLVFTSVFYLGILGIVLIWLYPLIRHLQQLRKSAQAFGEGALDQRVTITRTSYIADIEMEFNRMAQRIQILVDDNKLLGNAVSHDLRTPLARLRFGIEALQQTDNPANRDKYQRHISRDIDEMEKLVAVLLNYARMEQAMVKVDQHAIDLNSLINQCVGLQESLNNKIEWASKGELYVDGDEHYLAMLLNNLIDNALEHANTKIRIELVRVKNKVVLKISDDGSGIAEDKRLELLKPFTRGDMSEGKKSGYGMGLAIVTRIAQWHNAEFSIHDSVALGGAEFVVTFIGK